MWFSRNFKPNQIQPVRHCLARAMSYMRRYAIITTMVCRTKGPKCKGSKAGKATQNAPLKGVNKQTKKYRDHKWNDKD